MMTVDPRRLREINAAAKTPAEILGEADPGALSGSLSATSQGIVTGTAQVEGLVAGAAERAYQPVLNAIEGVTGVTPWNPFSAVREQADTWSQQYQPDPLTTGTVGQIMFDVSRVMTQVGIGAAATAATGGAAGPTLLAGAMTTGTATGRATYQQMQRKGVDASTAMNAAFVDAVTTGGGVLLPGAIGYQSLAAPFAATGAGLSRGAYYAANTAYGIGANVAMGVAQRSATHDLLESGGYTAMAKQYAPLDAAAVTAEGVLGGVFGALGARAGLPMRAQGAADAALAARDAKHAAIDTAPGVPADPETASAHNRALDGAIQNLMSGRPVDVSRTGVVDGQYVMGRRDQSAIDAARAEYGNELPVSMRYSPSNRLAELPAPQRAALRYDAPELNEYAAQVEQQYGLPPGLINALKNAGERSNSNQTSPAGARGVMQFMPENLRKYGVSDATDPVQMIDAAGRYLRDTMRQYGGNVDAMIADYNGGPRQAREVLAGRQPRAAETRQYLARVREWLGRDQAADLPIIARRADELPVIPVERARAASAIESEIQTLETERAELLATAGNAADLGQISTVRAELLDLQAQRAPLSDEATLRPAAKEIQASTPQTSYKQAVSIARRERAIQAAELDTRIARLEGVIRENADADRAAQRLASIDSKLDNLRTNRAAISEPAATERQSVTAVRSALADMGLDQSAPTAIDAGRPSDASPATARPATRPRTPTLRQPQQTAPQDGRSAGERPSQNGSERPSPAQVIDDPETQAGIALLDEQGDIVVPVIGADGAEANISLRQALAEADAELQYGRPEAFNAAVVCAMTRGT